MIHSLVHQTIFLMAHDGHGSTPIGGGQSLFHYLLEPLHAPLWIGASIVGYVVWKVIESLSRKLINRQPIDQDR